jgi:prepilin-type N-terminal cleavage/methylation domain-containing protein
MRASRSFTLIEVMLAVAIFATMITGFAVALDHALAMYIDLGQISKNRRMIESAASLVLATNNNLMASGDENFPDTNLAGVRWRTEEVRVSLTNGEVSPPFRKIILEIGGAKSDLGLQKMSFILTPMR